MRHPSPKTRVDLHVLSILSAFILSQDQTLRSMFLSFTVLIFYTLFVLFACCLSYSLCEGPFRSCGHLVSYHTSYFSSTLFFFFFIYFHFFCNISKISPKNTCSKMQKLSNSAESTSKTAYNFPSLNIGNTISLLLLASQAICPSNS